MPMTRINRSNTKPRLRMGHRSCGLFGTTFAVISATVYTFGGALKKLTSDVLNGNLPF